jgi:hypothetical protein
MRSIMQYPICEQDVAPGKVGFDIDGVRCRPEVGEQLLIPTRARHTVRHMGGTESRWLYGYAR